MIAIIYNYVCEKLNKLYGGLFVIFYFRIIK